MTLDQREACKRAPNNLIHFKVHTKYLVHTFQCLSAKGHLIETASFCSTDADDGEHNIILNPLLQFGRSEMKSEVKGEHSIAVTLSQNPAI
jgi:hypothetical protein